MNLLLDTHSFLWFVLNDPRLSADAMSHMSDPNNELFVSPATYWEMAIKVSLGKYRVSGDFLDFVTEQLALNRMHVLPIAPAHAAVVAGLPFHHRDPFDRMLAAQCVNEDMAIVSADGAFDLYGVNRIW